MTNPHLWIDDPGLPAIDPERPWLPPKIGSYWLCKRGRGTELNEIAGYQLAVAMQIPVPAHRFFVITSNRSSEPLVDNAIAPWRVGLLINEVSGPKVNYSDLLQSNTDSGIRHLGLRLFSTSEWPELIQTKQSTLAIDLEFVLAHLVTSNLDSFEGMDAAIEACRDLTEYEFHRCYKDAEQFGSHHRFLEALQEHLRRTHDRFFPNFSPLMNGRLIEKFYRLSFEARKERLLELVDLIC